MTTRVPMTEGSIARLRTAYSQFEQTSLIIAEAMGIAPKDIEGLDLPGGAFLVKDEQAAGESNGLAEVTELPPPTRSRR